MRDVSTKKCKRCNIQLTEENVYEPCLKDYFYICKVCRSKKQQDNSKKLKQEVIEAYGGLNPKCICCGESSIKLLTLDHIFNDGKQDRKERDVRGWGLYFQLKQEGFPNKDRLQVLCFNCNCTKGVFGICPHEKERKIKEFREKSVSWFKNASLDKKE